MLVGFVSLAIFAGGTAHAQFEEVDGCELYATDGFDDLIDLLQLTEYSPRINRVVLSVAFHIVPAPDGSSYGESVIETFMDAAESVFGPHGIQFELVQVDDEPAGSVACDVPGVVCLPDAINVFSAAKDSFAWDNGTSGEHGSGYVLTFSEDAAVFLHELGHALGLY
jgi:hypothetical protein